MPWRGPEHPDDFPSLGWDLLEWWAEHLPSPRDANKPLLFTDEQAMQLVEWYRIDPITGKRAYRRGYSRRSKGWGKSPVEAAKVIAELAGPVRFGGWDAHGEPVGRPWGTNDDPRAWVQVAAISEDQTDNTWSVVHYLLTENDGAAADALRIDAGLTRCMLRDQPGAKAEPVTSAAGSREGQPITYGVIDESHLMLPSNGGVKLARTIRRNVAKMGGTSYETTNSFIIGQQSVAETSYNAVRAGSPGIFADEVEAPREVGGVPVNESSPDEVLHAALEVAYGKSWWVPVDRLVADIRDPANTWNDSARFFLNWNMADGAGWLVVPRDAWTDCTGQPAPLVSSGAAGLSVGPNGSFASLAFAARRDDDKLQIEVVRQEAGTGWVVAACAEAYRETGQPIAVNPKSTTSAVLQDLNEAHIPVHEVAGTELVEACTQFQNAVVNRHLVHLGDAGLTDALRQVTTRNINESWVFSERASTGDITPLMAVTLAAHVARQWAAVGGGFHDLSDFLDD